MRFPKLAGSLIWVPDRFEVTEADADFYGGRTHFSYGLKPLGEPGVRPTASFDADFDRVDLSTLGAAFEWAGHSARRRHVGLHEAPMAKRPLCRQAWRRQPGVCAARRRRSSPAAQLPPDADDRDVARVRPWGPFNPDPRLMGDVPVAGELSWRLDPEWIDLAPSWMATADTYVSFEGRTAYGERSDDSVPRDQHRLAGKRPRAGGHHDGLWRAHHGRRRGRLRPVRRHHAPGVPAAAHRRALQRPASARLGRRVGRGHGRPGDRERLRHADQRARHLAASRWSKPKDALRSATRAATAARRSTRACG